MRGIRAVLATVLAVAAASVLAGCEPYGYAYPDGTADINIQVNPDGTAVTQVYFDGSRERSEEELLDAAHAAAHIFTDPGALPDISINGNSGGYPFAIVTTEHVFVPGADPSITFDTTEAVAYLLTQGLTSVDVSWRGIDMPNTPAWQPPSQSEEPGDGRWATVTTSIDAPRGEVHLHPEPNLVRAYGSVLAPIFAVVALAIGIVYLTARRHRAAAVFGGVALAAAVLGFAANGYDETGALAASGGPTWPYMLFLPLGLLSLGVLIPGGALVMMLGLARVPHPYVVFDPPPGWPQTEPGWLPYAGWYPPPDWPQAPKDWKFLTPVPKRESYGSTRWARATARAWVNWYRNLPK